MEDEHMEKDLFISKKYADNTKEADNMVRKAETLRNINELNLSSRAKTLIKKKFGNDPETIVQAGREKAFSMEVQPKYKEPGYIIELVKALDEAGFIRHDFYPWTWNILGFYINIVHRWASRSIYGVQLSPILTNRGIIFRSSKEYENMETVSYEDWQKIKDVLEDSLTTREREVLLSRFGLRDGIPKSLEAVGREFGVTMERIRQVEAKAFRKMGFPGRLCKLPALFGFVPPEEPEPPKDIDPDDIYNLNLCVRAHRCLKMAGITTITGILNLPKEDWPKVRNLGSRSMMEIQDKMRAAGYTDFSVR